MLRYQVLPHPPAGRHFGLGQEEKNQNSFKLPHITRSNTVGQHPTHTYTLHRHSETHGDICTRIQTNTHSRTLIQH
jgi:hypothetical protein